ncbi:RICIN domain-containing protein [Streptomyces sp. NRRL S-87]|uniref:RICIN domain-containing protein n=1 Tax=Streptomyces sp. NRRL S-87 TaxID=1463920 RepID=UPI001900157A|nr:RICIN domain-containing protein [Streptomyces sp. NRRL S-87]
MDPMVQALEELRTADELSALMLELKERSRLTYRQLEERAAGRGEPLPRSTLASVLRHRSLPRPELLVAFVHACGDGRHEQQWLAARQRIAEPPVDGALGDHPGAGLGADPAEEVLVPVPVGATVPVDGAGRRRRRVVTAAAVGLVTVLAAVATWSFQGSGGGRPATGPGPAGHAATAPDPSALPVPLGAVRIRPLAAPGLCLTDGRVPDGRYRSLVAVQRPCTETAPQRTTLVPLGGNAYRIQWYHPDFGTGCLKVRTGGAPDGLLEPWDACAAATAFQLEPGTAPAAYRFRVAGRGCVGIKAASAASGTEALVEPCSAARGELFVVEPATSATSATPPTPGATPRPGGTTAPAGTAH